MRNETKKLATDEEELQGQGHQAHHPPPLLVRILGSVSVLGFCSHVNDKGDVLRNVGSPLPSKTRTVYF